MMVSECPQCGAASSPGDRKCSYCRAEFFVTDLAYLGGFAATGVAKYLKHYSQMIKQDPDSIEGQLGSGLCYLHTGMYPLARKHFERVMELSPGVSQAYYYYGVACVQGRRLRAISLSEARQIEANLNTAIMIDDQQPHYKILLAMLKRDYYAANGMKVPPPSYDNLLSAVNGHAVNRSEIERLTDSVKVGDPDDFLRNVIVT